MKLDHGWFAMFLDDERCVHLTKRDTAQPRKLLMKWDGMFLKRIDPVTGLAQLDSYDRLPPTARKKLKGVCQKRWGEA